MKHNYFLRTLFLLAAITTLYSCGNDDSPEDYVKVSPVQVDLAAVPYAKLSEYKFFEGEMKNLQPAYKVIPYDLNSSLFTDYARKKRFIWMPEGQKATYNGDGKILSFPTGTVLIKNFYYDNVQPANTTKIIETRLMIKKAEGWIFANYVWNNEQTEAFKTDNGSTVNITWLEKGVSKTVDYNIPFAQDCFLCHQNNTAAIPIGPKPQNLNKNFTYADGSKNQLAKWIEEGYLTSSPNTISSTIDWTDSSKDIALRARSYIDINCAHCHTEGGECSHMPMKLAFADTENPENMGLCVQSFQSQQDYIIMGGDVFQSALYQRMETTAPSLRMPLVGRTVKHDEAIQLMKDYINQQDGCN